MILMEKLVFTSIFFFQIMVLDALVAAQYCSNIENLIPF